MRIVDIRRHPIRNSQLILLGRKRRLIEASEPSLVSKLHAIDGHAVDAEPRRGGERRDAILDRCDKCGSTPDISGAFFGRCGATFRISSSVTNVPRISRAACGLLSKVASLSGDSFLPVSQNSKASRSPCCKCRVEVPNGVNRIEHPPNWRCPHNCSPPALPRNLPRRRERHFVLAAWTGR